LWPVFFFRRLNQYVSVSIYRMVPIHLTAYAAIFINGGIGSPIFHLCVTGQDPGLGATRLPCTTFSSGYVSGHVFRLGATHLALCTSFRFDGDIP
jgi:hypothetical protein